jgi:hypothetical protein
VQKDEDEKKRKEGKKGLKKKNERWKGKKTRKLRWLMRAVLSLKLFSDAAAMFQGELCAK